MKKEEQKIYAAIDLKSFYASVECVERGLDPLTSLLVVADESRTEKTICLAVSPALKAYGVGGRARLFEAVQRVAQVNRERLRTAPGHRFSGKSSDEGIIRQHPEMEIDFVRAMPRMGLYIEYSSRIYDIYLKYIAPEDIHVYSIDEVFIDLTEYLRLYRTTARELTMRMIRDVLKNTGITATAGIGTNLYLAKVAMDIVAKHIPADSDGVRIAELDEMGYRRQLWNHKPLTDFWRIGHGTAARLEQCGIDTMGRLARASLTHEEFFYKTFGVNAELLIDHAWGWESCTMAAIKAYRSETASMGSGQVLKEPYSFAKARNVALEMADALSFDLIGKKLVTDQIVLYIGYDRESLSRPEIAVSYHGEKALDHYGRVVPKPAHGTVNLPFASSSGMEIERAVAQAFDTAVDPSLLVRRINITANHIVPEDTVAPRLREPDLFTDIDEAEEEERRMKEKMEKERKMQEAMLGIRRKYGKNAVLKGINYEDGATGRERNSQIGGHKA